MKESVDSIKYTLNRFKLWASAFLLFGALLTGIGYAAQKVSVYLTLPERLDRFEVDLGKTQEDVAKILEYVKK